MPKTNYNADCCSECGRKLPQEDTARAVGVTLDRPTLDRLKQLTDLGATPGRQLKRLLMCWSKYSWPASDTPLANVGAGQVVARVPEEVYDRIILLSKFTPSQYVRGIVLAYLDAREAAEDAVEFDELGLLEDVDPLAD